MTRRSPRLLELALWVTALVLLGVYGWAYLDRSVYQSYQGWAFERRLDGQPASVTAFVIQKLRFGGERPVGRAKSGEDDLDSFRKPPESNTAPQARRSVAKEAVLPQEGVIGRIEIPRIGVRGMVLEGTSDAALRRAIGHIEGTALPGHPGNIGLAGHRDTFFLGLKGIKKGDTIRIRTLDGTYTYEVESIKIVTPKDVDVLDPTPQPTLTLVTCYPFNFVGSAPDRYIVHARQVRHTPQS